mgnify:CR=1 FL=1
MNIKDAKLLNGLALAYMGDGVYDLYIREYLLNEGTTKPNQLHKKATQFVSARAQAHLIDLMFEQALLSEEEIDYFKRGRNAKSHTKAKNASAADYSKSSGFEALMGYLYLTKQESRLDTLIQWCIQTIKEEKSE